MFPFKSRFMEFCPPGADTYAWPMETGWCRAVPSNPSALKLNPVSATLRDISGSEIGAAAVATGTSTSPVAIVAPCAHISIGCAVVPKESAEEEEGPAENPAAPGCCAGESGGGLRVCACMAESGSAGALRIAGLRSGEGSPGLVGWGLVA